MSQKPKKPTKYIYARFEEQADADCMGMNGVHS